MSIKKILVPLDTQAGPNEAVLDTALAAARRFGAHLELLYVRPNPRAAIPYGELSSTQKKSVIEAVERSGMEFANQSRARFENFCARQNLPIVKGPPASAGVSAAWREEVGSESEALVQRALFADLIVVARPTRAVPSPEMVETALLETGQPVLVAPPKPYTRVGSHIAIGWNATSEAVRAIAAAMPCLADADSVTILTSAKRAKSAQELIEYLAWHDIASSLREFQAGSRSVGETLLDEVKTLKADLFVMGGYSHTRARQILFGGVTRHVLEAAELPILMAH